MKEKRIEEIESVIDQMEIEVHEYECRRYGSGHINDTFLITAYDRNYVLRYYILQRINPLVYKKPEHLLENIKAVTEYLTSIIMKNHGDPDRETLRLIPAKDGKYYVRDERGHYWRMYPFIEHTLCYDYAEKPEVLYESGVAFGRFQYLMSDFPAAILHETIPNFHNTPLRFEAFQRAVKEDKLNRVGKVKEEISFLLERKKEMVEALNMQKRGELPLRVTHNDTKLNNILIDQATGKGVCIIDLDTIMPGLSINDFGDSIRFGTNTATEDETDLSKVSISLKLFELYTKGFIEGSQGCLTRNEIDMLPAGAKLMTLECGMRFLTDYLQGDTYFKIHRKNQNLDRCRTQLALVKDMELKWEFMKNIVKLYKE